MRGGHRVAWPPTTGYPTVIVGALFLAELRDRLQEPQTLAESPS
jgi:hypothetical protein